MDTQEKIVAIAHKVQGPQNPVEELRLRTKGQSTYSLPLEGMDNVMLSLWQQRLKDQITTSKGDLKKVYMKISESHIVWWTGFLCSQMVFVSVGTNKLGKPCLNFDQFLSDAEIQQQVQNNRKKEATSSIATKQSSPDATIGISSEDAGF
jgi:hypothetical protein